MCKLLVLFLCVVTCPALAASPDANSPDFDPIARMQRFFPDWQPPHVSQEELAKLPLGTAKRPVRTQGPNGQERYLANLVCDNGESPGFNRRGSVGASPYGFPMDIYDVNCGKAKSTVYMDLYHPKYVEQEPVPGFTIRK